MEHFEHFSQTSCSPENVEQTQKITKKRLNLLIKNECE